MLVVEALLPHDSALVSLGTKERPSGICTEDASGEGTAMASSMLGVSSRGRLLLRMLSPL